MAFPSKYKGFPLKMTIFPWDSGIPTVDSLRQALLIRKDDAPAKAAGPKERGKGGEESPTADMPTFKKYVEIKILMNPLCLWAFSIELPEGIKRI